MKQTAVLIVASIVFGLATLVGSQAPAAEAPEPPSADGHQWTDDPRVIWKRQLGTRRMDFAADLDIAGNGDILISGYTSGYLGGRNQGHDDAFLARYRRNGALLWTRQLGTPAFDGSVAVAIDIEGHIVVSGFTFGALGGRQQGHGDAFVAKYGPAGKLEWVRQLGSPDHDDARGVATDSHGNVLISGLTEGSLVQAVQGRSDVFLAKYSPTGDLLWLRQFGTSEVDDPNGQLTVDADDNALMSGGTSGSFDGQTGPGAWVAKFDASGQLVWLRQIAGNTATGASGVATDADGNVVVGGTTGDGMAVGGPNQGYTDAWVAKYSSAGDLLWIRQFGSSEYDFEHCIATGREGDILIAGETSGSLGGSIQGETDAWVAKLTPNGDVLWVDQLGTEMTDKATNVAAGRAGNVLVTGFTYGSLGGRQQGHGDAWLMKLRGD